MRRNWLTIVLAVIVLVTALATGAYYWDRLQRTAVLACGDDQVAESVERAFDQSDMAHFERIRAMALDTPRETALDRMPYRRHCTARVVASDRTRRDVSYTIENTSDKEFRIAVKLLKTIDEDPPAPAGN
jgi:hypothetical protein